MTLKIQDNEKLVYNRPISLTTQQTHYCPGCTHGTGHRLIAEVLDELNVREQTIMVASVGCSVFAYNYFDVDGCEAPHGRAPAMATGLKRVYPDRIIFTYQGDGDLASIGMGEIMHAAARGEKITTIFINNATYGMTGGQMAPTSLSGQKTASSPFGRDVQETGYPMHIAEMMAILPGVAYSVRRSLHDARHVIQARQAIKQAFTAQQMGLGFSIVELLSTCPTNWGMTPVEACDWVRDNMVPVYPLGDFRVAEALQKGGRKRPPQPGA
jgi:2-oxoglutarate ferredoxin oxidoreductase subunit beta